MKKIIHVNQTTLSTDVALLLARIGISVLMLTHGLPKLVKLFSGDPVQFLPFMGLSPEVSLALAVFAEVFCSIFILFGFATRLAVIPLSITMLVAIFMVHTADPFSVKENAFHYLLVYLVLMFTGSGRYSIDYLLQGRSHQGLYRSEGQVPHLT